MKIRYRNRVTSEARDITVGSAEETTVKTEVFTVNGESLPLWVLDAEYDVIQAQEAKMTDAQPIFGHSSRRLTPGERAMGITSYEQKVMENNPDMQEVTEEEYEEIIDPTPTTAVNPGAGDQIDNDPDPESDEELDEVDDEDEEDDDDDIAVAAPSTPTRKPRRAPRRAPVRS